MNDRSSTNGSPDLIGHLGDRVESVAEHTADLRAALQPALEEVATQLELLDEHGAGYVKRYIDRHLRGEHPPPRPRGMHHSIADALRDIARDEVYAVRLYGRPAARETA